jgi:ABC-2 type transport system ATP-binding protein
MKDVIDTLDIRHLLDQPVRKLSLGQRMRCELAAALIHNPPLLFLDEPTIGLDVLVKLKIRDFLKKINEKYGTTILLTTHDLSDIEALCERVIMLDEGKIIYDGALRELRENWGEGKQIQFTFTEGAELEELQQLTEGTLVVWEQGDNEAMWLAGVDNDETMISEVIGKVASSKKIIDMKVVEITTEEIIRNIYEEGAVRHG